MGTPVLLILSRLSTYLCNFLFYPITEIQIILEKLGPGDSQPSPPGSRLKNGLLWLQKLFSLSGDAQENSKGFHRSQFGDHYILTHQGISLLQSSMDIAVQCYQYTLFENNEPIHDFQMQKLNS